MIYTITFNPSLDYIISVDDFALGKTNRTTSEYMLPGGKGLNVSTVLSNLGILSTALGFVAGFTGEEICKRTLDLGFHCDFISVKNGISRINIKIKDYDGTEINGLGPAIDQDDLRKLFQKLNALAPGDFLILAGSIPKSLPDTVYESILSMLADKNISVIVDASGPLLTNVLPYHPFLIKPNHHELGELFDVELTTRHSVIPYARKLQNAGARNVLVSLAKEGAVLLTEDGHVLELPAPDGTLVHAVGAGDSMVAGFLAGWLAEKDYLHAFKMAVSAGSASAFSEFLAKKEEILSIYDSLDDIHSFES